MVDKKSKNSGAKKKPAPKKSKTGAKPKPAAKKPAKPAKKTKPTKTAKPAAARPVKKAAAAKKAPAAPAKKAAAPSKKSAPAKKAAPPKGEKSETKAASAVSMKPATLTNSEIGRFRVILENKKQQILDDLSKNWNANLESSEEGIQDIADKASSSYTREFLYSLSDNERQNLQLIDDALVRIASGNFAICVACGNGVNRARLDAVPWARHCLNCQELQERGLL